MAFGKDSNLDKIEPFANKIWLSSPTMHGPELTYMAEAYDTNWMSTIGKNISEIVETNLRKQIAMLMQMPIVFPFSIYKNLEYVLDYHFKLSKNEKNDRIIDILKKVQLYDEIQNDLKMSAEKLSGGQKQRLCLARALLTEPKIILLDEPCSALDVYNTMCIENLLLNLKKELTIIIVTHNIQEAKRLNDRIIFMKDGKVIEDSKNFFDNMITEEAKAFINVN